MLHELTRFSECFYFPRKNTQICVHLRLSDFKIVQGHVQTLRHFKHCKLWALKGPKVIIFDMLFKGNSTMDFLSDSINVKCIYGYISCQHRHIS